jgi:hypothetical protein
VNEVQAAASKLGQHPHDHGWRELYRLFAYGLAQETAAPQLADAVATAQVRHPSQSAVHLVTLLGIAVNAVAGRAIPDLLSDRPPAGRLAALEVLLRRHRPEIDQILAQRQNSFTAPRRFLVPQVLLAAYFAKQDHPARFADLGTGLGILPRQLNSKTLFERFSDDLAWPDGYPVYQRIPLEARYGVDRGPFPDLAWVRSCYGPSAYYTAQFHELIENRALPEIEQAEVRYQELDLTDTRSLCRFIAEHGINAANLCYTLYEIEPPKRAAIVDAVAETLSEPGLMIVTEPHGDLTQPGCTVTVQDRARPVPRPLCAISDGHFRGLVTPLAGYREFLEQYPIRFDERTGAVDVDAASRGHATG